MSPPLKTLNLESTSTKKELCFYLRVITIWIFKIYFRYIRGDHCFSIRKVSACDQTSNVEVWSRISGSVSFWMLIHVKQSNSFPNGNSGNYWQWSCIFLEFFIEVWARIIPRVSRLWTILQYRAEGVLWLQLTKLNGKQNKSNANYSRFAYLLWNYLYVLAKDVLAKDVLAKNVEHI